MAICFMGGKAHFPVRKSGITYQTHRHKCADAFPATFKLLRPASHFHWDTGRSDRVVIEAHSLRQLGKIILIGVDHQLQSV